MCAKSRVHDGSWIVFFYWCFTPYCYLNHAVLLEYIGHIAYLPGIFSRGCDWDVVYSLKYSFEIYKFLRFQLRRPCQYMMTSSNGNIFRVTGPLCGEHKGQWRGTLMASLICIWINGWVNNREAGDLRRHRGDYNVILMIDTLSTVHFFRIILGECQSWELGYKTMENAVWCSTFFVKM